MRATAALKEEHRAVKAMLDIWEGIGNRWQKTGELDEEGLSSTLEFAQVFVDRCHHGKEEDLLFPALEEAGIQREGGPIGVMLKEHEEGRSHIREIASSLKEYQKGNREAAKTVVDRMKAYVDLLRQHIEKEDTVLYVLADQHFSPEKEEELLRGFETIEEERIGKGRHEAFHRMLHELRQRYPK
ncbi:MAG: hemerythrin domain-containing protein [Candidatus Atribacteria bacterium]|nr:hemerythrin domain-containing protein [Candidatus Atribacteria bacterium]